MKASTLLFRSLAVIIFIAGGAQLFSYLSPSANANNGVGVNLLESETIISESEEGNDRSKQSNSELIENKFPVEPGMTITDLLGTWKVTYNSDEFVGAIIYELKKENGVIKAFTREYQDENGYGEKAGNEVALIVKEFDGSKGKGQYNITYEGEKYSIDCDIKIINKITFELSYDYYGYGDTETWKKL